MAVIKFIPEGKSVEVAAGTHDPGGRARRAARRWAAACGGNLACSTCHVWVKQGFDSLSELEDDENDILDKAFDVRPSSRLGHCQAKVDGQDLECEITRAEPVQAFYDEHPDERPAK